MKKYQSISISILFYIAIILLWQLGDSPILPSPGAVLKAVAAIMPLIGADALCTLSEAFFGLVIGVGAAFVMVLVMDFYKGVRVLISPIIVTSQAVPFNVIAPFIVVAFGFGIMPKITVVALVCFFPLTLNLMAAFDSISRDLLDVAKLYGASKWQRLYYLKMPQSMPSFFAGLKIGAVYSVSGAFIAEWMAGDRGLGLFMLRAKRSYQIDRVFAIVLIITAFSILLYYILDYIQKKFERSL